MTDQEELELLRDAIEEIRLIRGRIHSLEDTLKLIVATKIKQGGEKK